MNRRTLALIGAIALAVTGLASPANASSINTPGDIEFAATELDNSGVRVDLSSPHDQSLFQLDSTTGSAETLFNFTVEACIGTNPNPIVLVQAYPDVAVPAAGEFTTSDPAYTGTNPSRDIAWDAGVSGVLSSSDFKIVLFDASGVEMARTEHGSPVGSCLV